MTSPRLNAFQEELNAADDADAKAVRIALVGAGHYGCARRVRSAKPAVFTALLIGLLAISGGVYVLALRSCDSAVVWVP